MAPPLIVDASVGVKWILPEAGSLAALELLDAHAALRVTLMAPALFVGEVLSALTKRVRQRKISPTQAREGYQFLLSTGLHHHDAIPLMAAALELSIAMSLNLYDCVYLALAIEHRCDLITADERFFSVAARTYPFVQLLDIRPRYLI